MLFLRKPTAEFIDRYLERQAQRPLGFEPAGISRGEAPAGYQWAEARALLGEGEAAFAAARRAICRWAMMPREMLEVYPAAPPPEPGTVVAILIKSWGLWWLNSCRVLFVEETGGTEPQFALTYGTLPDHLERGEERFGVRMTATGEVWYELRAVWRHNQWASRVMPAAVRKEQARFRRLSCRAMQMAVEEERGMEPSLEAARGEGR